MLVADCLVTLCPTWVTRNLLQLLILPLLLLLLSPPCLPFLLLLNFLFPVPSNALPNLGDKQSTETPPFTATRLKLSFLYFQNLFYILFPNIQMSKASIPPSPQTDWWHLTIFGNMQYPAKAGMSNHPSGMLSYAMNACRRIT